MRPEQDWCLNCGLAVTTRIAPPPSWRGPLAALTGALLLGLAALALAFFALADDDPSPAPRGEPTPAPVQPTPTPEQTPAPGGEADPQDTPEGEAPPDDGDEAPADDVATWPSGERAWTIVLSSTSSRSAAERRARRFTAQGVDAGVLSSDDYSSLRPGFWVVFSGQYDSSRAAAAAQRELGADVPASAYVREIVPG